MRIILIFLPKKLSVYFSVIFYFTGTVDAAELLRENLSEYRQTRTPSVSIDMNSNYGDFPYWKIRGDELILARKTITPIIYQYRIQTYGNEGLCFFIFYTI